MFCWRIPSDMDTDELDSKTSHHSICVLEEVIKFWASPISMLKTIHQNRRKKSSSLPLLYYIQMQFETNNFRNSMICTSELSRLSLLVHICFAITVYSKWNGSNWTNWFVKHTCHCFCKFERIWKSISHQSKILLFLPGSNEPTTAHLFHKLWPLVRFVASANQQVLILKFQNFKILNFYFNVLKKMSSFPKTICKNHTGNRAGAAWKNERYVVIPYLPILLKIRTISQGNLGCANTQDFKFCATNIC